MTGSRPTRTSTNARQRTEPDDQCPSAVSKSSTVGRSDSSLCTHYSGLFTGCLLRSVSVIGPTSSRSNGWEVAADPA